MFSGGNGAERRDRCCPPQVAWGGSGFRPDHGPEAGSLHLRKSAGPLWGPWPLPKASPAKISVADSSWHTCPRSGLTVMSLSIARSRSDTFQHSAEAVTSSLCTAQSAVPGPVSRALQQQPFPWDPSAPAGFSSVP